jgi:hypothetical protein
MTNPAVSRVLQASLVVMNLVIGAVILEIGKGTIPIPDDLKWTVPIILAALNGISLFLPRVGSERLAQQVDALKAEGVPKSDMVVMDRRHTDALAEEIVTRIRRERGETP